MEQNDKHKIIKRVIKKLAPIAILLAAGFAYLFVFLKLGFGIPCIFRTLTGYKCPGCGMTHAMAAVWNRDFKLALEYNVLSLTALPVLCIYLLYRFVRGKRENGKDFYIWEYIFLAVMLIVVLGYGYIRNQ